MTRRYDTIGLSDCRSAPHGWIAAEIGEDSAEAGQGSGKY
jgi:hypothetical protein